MDWIHDDGPLDPRNVFLDASDVMSRYGWGKTKGHQNLKDRSLVPPPVMTHPDRCRLDELLAWPMSAGQVAELAGIARPTASRHVQTLRKRALVLWDGQGPKDPRASWMLH